jgi:hypothetical protein
MEEFRNEVIRLYDEYLMQEEKRGVSYGELAYIQDLNDEELNELYNELLKNIKEVEE